MCSGGSLSQAHPPSSKYGYFWDFFINNIAMTKMLYKRLNMVVQKPMGHVMVGCHLPKTCFVVVLCLLKVVSHDCGEGFLSFFLQRNLSFDSKTN